MTWQHAKLKFVARFGYGEAVPADETQDDSFKVFGSNGPYSCFSRSNTLCPVIIVGRKGSYGKVNWSNEPCFASDTTFFIDSSTTKNDLRWVFWLLQTLRLDEGSNEAAVPGLNRETAYEKEAALPPLQEQRAIADYLDRGTVRLNGLVEVKERLLELLEEKRRALITRAITRGLDPDVTLRDSGISWVGEIPIHWNIEKLKYLANLKSGETITSESITETGDYPVFGGNGLRGFASSFTHEGHYVLIGRQGALCGNVHIVSGRFWASEHAIVVSMKKEDEVFWLGELLRAMNLNQYSESAAQPGLAVDFIANLQLPVPSLTDQRSISTHIKTKMVKMDKLKEVTKRTIALLKERRAALIAAAVTGQIKVV